MKTLTPSERILGIYKGNTKGPLLCVTVAVHGNEPSGVLALEQIFKTLNEEKPDFKGTLVGIIGNTAALKQDVRYIDEDLNRTWTQENLEARLTVSNEKKEMFDIIDLLEGFDKNAHTARYFIDCHTTSSDSLPYISVQNVGGNKAWAQEFPIHLILGFSDMVKGTIDGYLSAQGITGFTVEAGQHANPKSKMYHEGIIWIALEHICGLHFKDLKALPESVTETLKGTPEQKTFKILHRFGLQDDDDFSMVKGFENFQRITEGEHLATLNGTEIRSAWNAFIFMPLYQAKGNDGFFVIEEVK